jgi:putative oxidoreductase
MMHGILGRCWRWCHNKAVGILVLRLVLGAFFISHGLAKFQNLEQMKAFFDSLGLMPWMAILVACAEILSGTALILGAFVWVAATLISIVMAVAIWKVTSQASGPLVIGFISGWGTNLVYAAAALCIAFCGAGRYSLTAWWLRRRGLKKEACRDCMAGHGLGHDCPDCPPTHAGMSEEMSDELA